MKKGKIIVSKDGPYLVFGKLPMEKEIIQVDSKDIPIKWKKGKKYPTQENITLCRCGNSKNKPYCDGSHIATKFDGTETASREKFSVRAEKISGEGLELLDDTSLCALARFCDRDKSVWQLTRDSKNPRDRKIAIQEACDCPSGRLVAVDKKTGKHFEPKFKESLGLIEDPSAGASGPLWVKGGVEIESADGKKYEKRNRVTLCRCGKSMNKPFCDGRHIAYRFNDGDKSIKKK